MKTKLTILAVLALLMTGCVSTTHKAKLTFRDNLSFHTLTVIHNPGTVDIYCSTNLVQWSYLNTVSYTNSSMSVSMDQPNLFFQGEVSSATYNIMWNPSTDTNVVGFNIYVGPSINQFNNKFTAMGEYTTNTIVTILSPTSQLYFAATAFNNAGWESSYSTPVEVNVTNPVINLQ